MQKEIQIKTVGFIALDAKGNPITTKIYTKAATAKGLMTKAAKEAAEKEAAEAEAKRLELAAKVEAYRKADAEKRLKKLSEKFKNK